MWGERLKKIIIFWLLITSFNIINISAEEVPFRIISGSVRDGAENAPISSVICFDLSLRIDPDIKGITVNGSDELIDKILLKEGKKLEIYLKESLKSETEYTVSLAGIKEIYESRTLENPAVTFKTRGSAVLLSEMITGDTYKAKIKNGSSEKKDITVVIAAKWGNEIKALKVITQETKGGEEKEFSHTFTGIDGKYNIFAYAFLDLGEMVTVTTP